ncbi:MAG: PhoH family protein [Gemmatimonadetes bacterium]|nr:PhoH family protein [Gemmatimonadota bacterium]
MSANVVKRLHLVEVDPLLIYGHRDQFLRHIQDAFPHVQIVARGADIYLEGAAAAVASVEGLFLDLTSLAKQGKELSDTDIRYFTEMAQEQGGSDISQLYAPKKQYFHLKKQVKPKTLGQEEYIQAMGRSDIVFGIGPAGTGKTYLAVAAAVSALRRREKNRIVLVRPAVEAGESLGFLPGDFQEKVDPYLRPLYDALQDLLGADRIRRSFDMDIVEVAPLAYMRGRTLNDAFVILDEAQNSTIGQMKMFLTRLGTNSRAVITGDVTQIDLPDANESGLVRIQPILQDVPGIEFVYLTPRDVVRHHLVQRIIRAFDDHTMGEAGGPAPTGGETREQKTGAPGGGPEGKPE